MAGIDNFCLQLNEFESNIKTFWNELEADKDFCDVTLACEYKQIKAHKVVIFSYSPIFRNILKLNQNTYPLIYLRKVKYRYLQNLLTFMYQGEVNVAEEDLHSFLEVAEDLQVKGLSERNKEGYSFKKEDLESDNQKGANAPKRKRTTHTHNDNIPDRNAAIEPLTESLNTRDELNENANTSSAPQFQSEIQSKEVIKHENDRNLISVNGGKKSATCDKYDKQFSSNPNLWHHKKSVHEGVRFPCENCDYKATEKRNLQRHKLRVHTNQ